jgi:hypothetical protein
MKYEVKRNDQGVEVTFEIPTSDSELSDEDLVWELVQALKAERPDLFDEE